MHKNTYDWIRAATLSNESAAIKDNFDVASRDFDQNRESFEDYQIFFQYLCRYSRETSILDFSFHDVNQDPSTLRNS